ncbi:MAG TPA: hypothetical protein VHU90_00500 [Galbitalea sp.]|nr:hypothetical protein [Galbitalea sp.]
MRRALMSWLIGFVLLIAAFFACVAILNATVYSAHGFVSSYLDALNRHDATTARELPGVRAPSGVATNLLTDGALGSIADIHLEHDTAAGGGGIHSVEYSYKLGTRRESSTYSIVQTSSYLGLFSRWAFEKSPLATVSVAAPHDPRFRVNATDVVSTVKRTESQPYVVFTPGLYAFDLKTTYLIATPVSVPVTEPASVTPVRVEAEANKMFVTEVSTELHKYYLACATQTVLLPTACPFGKSFSNRVVSTPAWSMVSDPPVTVIPDQTSGRWLVPSAVGVAHLVVKVQSLYDGSISTFDSDVSFTVSCTITIDQNNHLTITTRSG